MKTEKDVLEYLQALRNLQGRLEMQPRSETTAPVAKIALEQLRIRIETLEWMFMV